MLVISPEACIDCGVCEPECPAEAIVPDSIAPQRWVELNAEYASIWPLISTKGVVPDDAERYHDADDKFDRYFSASPGAGDA